MMRLILLATLALSACAPSDERAIRALEGAGFTNIELGLYQFMACSDDDKFNVAFTADNIRGQRVSGAVCCGMFKRCTVRLD